MTSPIAIRLPRTFSRFPIRLVRLASLLAALMLCAARGSFADYRIERIASGLNQPSSVAFAPGDNNTMYIVERSQNNNVNMGKVLKYDIATRTKSTILDLGGRLVGGADSDLGAMCLVFHPDFNEPSSIGYHKLYLSTAADEGTNPATNRV